MPRWNDGLVDAFPIPDASELSLDNLKIRDEQAVRVAEHDLQPLKFFGFPAEIRNHVYNLVLFSKAGYRGADGRRKGSRLAILQVSKRFHTEAAYALYTTYKFLIFPLQVFTSIPTVRELPGHYRSLVTNLEMTVGSSWTSPPKSWRVSKTLARCLGRLKNLQTLVVFVEVDPSHPTFKRYRISYNFYTDFCGELLQDVLEVMPQLKYVQLDGNPSVDVYGPLVSRLRQVAETQHKIIKWGREADWARKAVDYTPVEVNADEPQLE